MMALLHVFLARCQHYRVAASRLHTEDTTILSHRRLTTLDREVVPTLVRSEAVEGREGNTEVFDCPNIALLVETNYEIQRVVRDVEVLSEGFYLPYAIEREAPCIVAIRVGATTLDLYKERRATHRKKAMVWVKRDSVQTLCIERSSKYPSLVHEAEKDVLSGFSGQSLVNNHL